MNLDDVSLVKELTLPQDGQPPIGCPELMCFRLNPGLGKLPAPHAATFELDVLHAAALLLELTS